MDRYHNKDRLQVIINLLQCPTERFTRNHNNHISALITCYILTWRLAEVYHNMNVLDEADFPWPIKVQHRFPGLSDDIIFHGIEAETKQNRVQSLQVELIGEMADGFSQ